MPVESKHWCAGRPGIWTLTAGERCPNCQSEAPGNDLGAPSSAPVDSGATDTVKGPQKYPGRVAVSRQDLGLAAEDPVHSPQHYRQFPIEVIEITERLGFCLGNVIKYTLRCDYKGKPLEDLKKARWYLDREIARREAETDSA